MKEREGIRAKAAKSRRPKRTAPKRRTGQKVRRDAGLSAVGMHERLDILTRELREALEQQSATSEVLRVISASPGELKPVFQAILQKATRICEAKFGTLFLYDGNAFHFAADVGAPQEYTEFQTRRGPFQTTRGSQLDQVLRTKRVSHTPDYTAEPVLGLSARVGGARSSVCVPILKDEEMVGAIQIFRQEVRPFSEKQIALLENFASQAVIAIENTRLFNELRDSLEQQTATAEVLKVVSSSPGDLEPVFQAMLENATRICGAKIGILFRYENDAYTAVATRGVTPAYAKYLNSGPIRPGPTSGLGRIASTRQTIHVVDALADGAYAERDPLRVATAELGGARSLLNVPMLKEGELVGAIGIYRQEVQPFTDKQIALVSNFAAQAVIAIENARLLNELRQRTDDLTESLEQQTATSEVLQVISSSPGELEPVFNAMLANATKLCDASYGAMWLREGDDLRNVAFHGSLPPAFTEQWRTEGLLRPGLDAPASRAMQTRKPVHVADLSTTDAYRAGEPLVVTGVDVADIRTLVAVPMLKEGEFVGAIAIYRREVRPFTDKQIALVTNFAAQAVIAIENTRLLSELRESLQQQTATAEVLKVISRSAFDLQPVLDSIVETASRLCDAEFAIIFKLVDGTYHVVASNNADEGFVKYASEHPIPPGRGSLIGRTALEGKTVHLPDCLADPEYTYVEYQQAGKYRSDLGVPLLREGVPIGVIALMRTEVKPFTDKQIELVETFADQAVIAIENVRLFEDVQARTRELSESLQQQTATADVLKVISRSTFDLQAVLDTLVESAARLCGADSAAVHRPKGDVYPFVASYGYSPEYERYMRDHPISPERPGSILAQVLRGRKVVQVADVQAEPHNALSEQRRIGGYRTILGVPLLREGVPIGVLILTRSKVHLFTEKQVELVQTFADQAVIAIENVRLFESVEARTRELAKSLEDLRTAQDRLVQTEKLASLGQLTAGIAHEIKNPLNFVNNFSAVSAELIDELQQALQGVKFDEKASTEIIELMVMLRGNLDKVVQHGKRADSIVKNMLLHSRQGLGEHRMANINAIVEEGLNLAYHGARAEKQGFNITLKKSLDPNAGEVDLFPQEITRVLLNLISNGFYAATKRKTTAGNNGYEPILSAETRNLGDRVEIRIRDNGSGIPPEVKARMFNPFFTTKPAGEGTGLGLSISYDIVVKQHCGSIEVDTEPGEFTEFRIILPRNAATLGKTGATS